MVFMGKLYLYKGPSQLVPFVVYQVKKLAQIWVNRSIRGPFFHPNESTFF